MSTQKNLITLCFAAVFTLGLAACGGGGGGGAPVTDMTVIDPAGPPPEDEDEAAAKVVAATKAAATKVTAIGTEADQSAEGGVDAGLGGSLPTDATDSTYSMTISRDRDGTTVKIADTANDMDDDPKFIDQDAGLGGGRTMHVRTMEPNADGEVVEEVVIVKTDIDAPTATPFADEYMLDTNPNTAEQPVSQSFTVAEANVGMWSSSEFPSTPDTTREYAQDNGDTEDMNEGAIEGTFDGADGTFECLDDACSIVTDADGKLLTVNGMWHFTPDEGVTVDVADANYLQYGFWLMTTTKDGTTYNEVETFAEAKGPGHPETGHSNLALVVGSATYEGGSVGVYVKNVLDDQADIVSATSGHFSADVELNATFGGDGVIPNDKFTIGGTITKFVLQHGEANDWAVGLGLADFSGRDANDPGESTPGTTPDNEFDGVATGDSTAAPGTWNGVFYGSSEETGDPAINPQPVAVTGEFNANFTDGTAAGGFGANIKK